jgi:hypothetical protein
MDAVDLDVRVGTLIRRLRAVDILRSERSASTVRITRELEIVLIAVLLLKHPCPAVSEAAAAALPARVRSAAALAVSNKLVVRELHWCSIFTPCR